MHNYFKNIFRIKSTLILLFLSVFCLFLSVCRIFIAENKFLLFLIWNLFLAFIPWCISSVLYLSKSLKKIIFAAAAFIWLIFFPNALYIVTDIIHLKTASPTVRWYDLILLFSYGKFKDIHLSMRGKHQVNNAALAILGLTVLRTEQKLHFTDEQLYCGLNEAFLTARIEVLQKKPLFILDGSHNTEGIKALTETLLHLNYKRLILGIGILKDKNYGDMLKMLIPEASEIVVTEVPVARTLKAEELFKEASLLHSNVYCEKNIFAALKKTFSAAEEEDLILWCGSLYLAGEIKKAYYFLRQEDEK